MEVLKAIRTILLNDSDISDTVDTRVYSFVVPQEATLPFILLNVISLIPSDTKSGASELDKWRIQIDSFAKTGLSSITLDKYVRAAIDRLTAGTVENVSIQGVRLDETNNYFDYEREIRVVSSDYEVRVARGVQYGSIPGITIFGEYVDDAAAIAAGLSVGDLYYLAEGNLYGLPYGMPKKVGTV